jgi:excisionase family DNA binding protein
MAATMKVDEAGKELGISRNAAYQAARAGEIPTIRIGRRLLVPRVALERMLVEAGQKAAPKAE